MDPLTVPVDAFGPGGNPAFWMLAVLSLIVVQVRAGRARPFWRSPV